jgi:hypothetical protein
VLLMSVPLFGLITDMYTHIILTCKSERDTTTAYALLDGQSVGIMSIPSHYLERITVRRVAPKTLRLDNKTGHDIDLASIRQILTVQLRLVESFKEVQELDGLSS